ncbi:MAG: spore germination protein [bacterium]|nr:spore germination protein [bacterium]
MSRPLAAKLEDNLGILGEVLGAEESFDVIIRRLQVAGRGAALVFIDGLVKEDVVTQILRTLAPLERSDLTPSPLEVLNRRWLPFIEVTAVKDLDGAIEQILSGPLVFLLDGEDKALAIDAREYPVRALEEPELERVVRGSRDGFAETIVFNTALVRRRLRDPQLRVRLYTVGRRSRTDVALLYIRDIANPGLVSMIAERIQAVDVDGLPMGEKSLEEFITGKRAWWNPFPVVRYTERPDVVAVHLLEGHVAVAVDTSPGLMLLPVTIFHHMQHAEDYRQDPAVGVYLRWVRFLAIGLSWIGPPLWVALVLDKQLFGGLLDFLGPRDPALVPLPLQFILGEVGIDLVRLALIHTPNALATSLGFIGAILLGEVAIRVGLFTAEAILYVAVAAIGTFATPSLEFAQAVRLTRLILLVVVAGLRLPGLAVAVVILAIALTRMRSFGVPYMWPLWPLHFPSLVSIAIRTPVPQARLRPRFLGVRDPDRMAGRGPATDPELEWPFDGDDESGSSSPGP